MFYKKASIVLISVTLVITSALVSCYFIDRKFMAANYVVYSEVVQIECEFNERNYSREQCYEVTTCINNTMLDVNKNNVLDHTDFRSGTKLFSQFNPNIKRDDQGFIYEKSENGELKNTGVNIREISLVDIVSQLIEDSESEKNTEAVEFYQLFLTARQSCYIDKLGQSKAIPEQFDKC